MLRVFVSLLLIGSSFAGPLAGLGDPPDKAEPLPIPGINTGLYERDVAISADGRELYYGLLHKDYAVIANSVYHGGSWSEPEVATAFRGAQGMNLEAHITPDGSRLMFLSTRRQGGDDPEPGLMNQDIWVMDREGDGWGKAWNLGAPVNSEKPEYFPSVTRDGTLYFTREEEPRRNALYRAITSNGSYVDVERMPDEINSAAPYNTCVSPDGSYVIACAHTEDCIGNTDYCVSFQLPDGTWTPLRSLGESVNRPGSTAISPSLSADGSTLFFSAAWSEKLPDDFALAELIARNCRAGGGSYDLYWISTAFIDALRPQAE